MTPCSVCARRDASNYFRITKVSVAGESPLTQVCSAKCMAQWIYQYATLQGARAVWTAKEAVRKFFDPKG